MVPWVLPLTRCETTLPWIRRRSRMGGLPFSPPQGRCRVEKGSIICDCSISCSYLLVSYLSILVDARNSVFVVCDQVRLIPVCSATRTSYLESFYRTYNKNADQTEGVPYGQLSKKQCVQLRIFSYPSV